MENKIDVSKLNESNIYEGGSLSQISADDLKDNVIAIKQLINNHLLLISENRRKELEIQDYKSTIEYLNSSPFISIIAAVISFSGSILIGFAVNLFTQNPAPSYSWIILLIGGILVLSGALSNILYPYARKWFNRKNAR